MDKNWIIITPEELKEFLPTETSQELLQEISKNISNYLNSTKKGIERLRKKKEAYKHLNDAKKYLDKALESLELGRAGFSPDSFTLLIDDKDREKK